MGNFSALAAAAIHHFPVIRSVIPTSKEAVKAITRTVRETHREARNIIVEYGPGTGEITQSLLRPGMLAKDGSLIAIELVQELADHTQKTINDDRLKVVCGDAQIAPEILQAQGIDTADQIFSGIPFSAMSNGAAEKIVRQTYDMLKPGGVFVVYQVKKDIKKLLEEHFDSVTEKHVLWNFPPLHVYVASKEKEA